MKRCSALVLLFGWLFATALRAEDAPPKLPHAAPETVGMSSTRLRFIDEIVNEGLRDGKMPGCVVLIARQGKIVFEKAYGHRQLEPEREPMTTDTVFDMASITKPVATATSILRLIQDGKLALDDRVTKYIPEFAQNGKQDITILHLLTHQAGLIPDNALRDYEAGREEALKRICELKPQAELGTRFIYSDVGFIVLGELVERITGQNVHRFSQEHIFRPLGMTDTGYLPPESMHARCATTEKRDGEWIRGEVHDPRAYRLGGIAGHAGLFSTAQDLAVYAQMMLNGGEYGGRRILDEATVKLMTTPVTVSSGLRGLGWDMRTGYSSNRGDLFSPRAFGHGGFTGTVLWMDPELQLTVIFLSNRVHPDGKGSVNPLAGRIGTIAAAAIVEAERGEPGAESQKRQESGSRIRDAAGEGARSAASREQGADGTTLERFPILSTHDSALGTQHSPPSGSPLSALRSPSSSQLTLAGIDVLKRGGFQQLQGRKVGLITNHTGIDREGVSTVVLLHQAPGVQLVALFSPEHGFEGKLDVSKIGDTRDARTGLKVYSLYGETRRPTPEMLKELDTLVFDIQDIGARFYTYISTMGMAMQAAAEHGLRFVVLDRPNPINGVDVAGPVLDAGKESFVGFHTLPVRHGMTVGELAQLFKAEWKLDLDLQVVPVEGWQRKDFFDATGLWWVNPSPNMRNLNEALLYPGIGLLETTNLSVGRGTDTPFEIIGAPWLDGQRLAERLNNSGLEGVRFVPVRFQPESSKFAGEECSGVHILITDRSRLEPVRTGLQIATLLQELYPETWNSRAYLRLLGNQQTLDLLQAGKSVDEIQAAWQPKLDEFRQRRQRALIYGRG